MSKRSHNQFNTTIYGLNDRHRGSEMGGLQRGQLVDLTSHYKGETRVVKDFMVAPCNIRGGCTATYFPEANVLVSINSTADRSKTPVRKWRH